MMHVFPAYPLNLTACGPDFRWTAGVAVGRSVPFIGATEKGHCHIRPVLAPICAQSATKMSHSCKCRRENPEVSKSPDQSIRERGSEFLPKFDSAGLLSAVVQDADSGSVLMVAFMDADAIAATRETGFAHFHSRSRGRLWKKGETSGDVLKVVEIRVDCDQDALLIRARAAGPTCHTGARSCFYRALSDEGLVSVMS